MSLRLWGYEKVRIFYDVVRPTPDQDLAFTGDIIRGPDGLLWEFIYREDGRLRVNKIVLDPV
tara:strand:+ start:266 stop:451 length:186 start_codon:yes stop_codon:yes gene_type:complete